MSALHMPKSRRVDIVGLLLCGGLTLIALLQVIQPHLQAQEVIAAQHRELGERHGKLNDLNGSLETYKKRLHTLQQAIETGPHKLLSARQINQRLVELTELATQQGLSIRNLQPGGTTSLPRFQIVQIDVSGSGNYRSAATFLHRLHEVFPDMGVRSFELSADTDASAMMYHVNLAWYVKPK